MLFVSLLVLMLSVLAFVIRNVFDKRRREDAVEHRKSDEEVGGDEGDCKDSGSLVE